MKVYIAVRNSSSAFYSFTGLTIKEFDYLNKSFCHYLPVNPSTGRPHTLSESAHKLFFILFYYRHYMIQDVLAILMRVDQSQISRWIRMLALPFKKATGKYILKAGKKITSLEEFKSKCPKLAVIFDATERPVNRPLRNQSLLYSGKKKFHTVKNYIVINASNKQIIYSSKTYIGKAHDFDILKRSKPKLPKYLSILADTGYIGLADLYPENRVILPNKASKNFPLTQAEKSQNTIVSSNRVHIEHVYALMKHNHILSQKFRGSGELADSCFQAIAGLYNFKMQCRHS